MKFDRESHPIKLVEPYEVEFKKPTSLEKIGMKEVIRSFCCNYTGFVLLDDNIIEDFNCIRLKNPTIYQEIVIDEFKITSDEWIVGIGTKGGRKYFLRIY